MDDTDEPETGDRTGDTETDPATVRYEWDQSGDPSVALVEAVATATDRKATDLPPLHQAVDPGALDALLTGNQSSAASVSLLYADTAVSIHRNGSIEIQVDGSAAQGDGD